VASAVIVRTENAAPERALEMFERLDVSAVELHLDRWLSSVAREGAFCGNKPKRVSEPEIVHNSQSNLCAALAQGATFHISAVLAFASTTRISGPSVSCAMRLLGY
jgi:hypothetical protein